MRERQRLGKRFDGESGITPAYAGKTNFQPSPQVENKDHPRVCGKDALIAKPENRKLGSPPRMRERPSIVDTPIERNRITPAYAGKTLIKGG